MANKNMTYDEIIKILQEKMANGEIITIEELDDFVRNCSVVDEFAAPDAITLFYGSVSDEFMDSIVAQNSSKFRVIKRTDAYKLLNSDTFNIAVENAMKHKYPDLDYKQIQSIISDYFNAAGSISATGEKIEGGKWAVVSERFAADTKGDAYAFVFDANGNRIFDMDELPSWLENVSDDKKMNGITRADLMKLNEGDRFLAIRDKVRWDFRDSKAYYTYDNKEKINGLSFGNTPLEGIIDDITPEKSEIVYATLGERFNILSETSLYDKFSFLRGITDEKTLDSYRLADYQLSSRGISYDITSETPVYVNKTGEIIGVDVSRYIDSAYKPAESVHRATFDELSSYLSDSEIFIKYPGSETILSEDPTAFYMLKQQDYLITETESFAGSSISVIGSELSEAESTAFMLYSAQQSLGNNALPMESILALPEITPEVASALSNLIESGTKFDFADLPDLKCFSGLYPSNILPEIISSPDGAYHYVKIYDQYDKQMYKLFTSDELAIQSSRLSKVSGFVTKASPYLKALAYAGIAVSGAFMIKQAYDASMTGDIVAACKIVRDWTLESGGAIIGAESAMSAVSPIASALMIGGGVGGIVAGGALYLIAGIVGGAIGSELGELIGIACDKIYEGLDALFGDGYHNGGDGNNQMLGDDGDNNIEGKDGDDTIFGFGGSDIIYGDNIDGSGTGNDILIGGVSLNEPTRGDEIHGGNGDDIIFGDDITIKEGTENEIEEQITGDNDYLYGDAGNDVIYGGGGNDIIYGGEGNDVIIGGYGMDIIYGGAGDDVIYGGGVDNSVVLDDVNMLYGGDGDDTIYGGACNDIIYGGDGEDKIFGEEGNDVIYGDAGNDYIDGGSGNDYIFGSILPDEDGKCKSLLLFNGNKYQKYQKITILNIHRIVNTTLIR